MESVWMIEAGEGLRMKQKELLCGPEAEMHRTQDRQGYESISKYANIPIRWVEDVTLLPIDSEKEKSPFIIAHEFFDALPIHAFESVAPARGEEKPQLTTPTGNYAVRPSSASKVPQWRELLVTPSKWKPSLKPLTDGLDTTTEVPPDFQLTLAKASTPTSLVLPEKPRYQRLKSQASSRIEISPESSRYVQDLALRIGGFGKPLLNRQSGAALIIDYGPSDTVPVNSLRGIKSHKTVSPFSYPGGVDISADVDFTALADAALEATECVEVHGPVEQGVWLSQLGIKERAQQLLKNVNDEEKRTQIETGWKRLVEGGPRGMGKAYKVMAVVPENGGRRRPVGFGGDTA